MARQRDPSGRWAVLIAAFLGSLIGAVALLLSVPLTSSEARKTQEQAFEDQRNIADRDELRDTFDDAAVGLNNAIIETQRTYLVWSAGRSPMPVPPELEEATREFARGQSRLGLRLPGGCDVFDSYLDAGELIRRTVLTMEFKPATSSNLETVENLLENELPPANTEFVTLAQRFLASGEIPAPSPLHPQRGARNSCGAGNDSH
jgi:hypothetical protein